MITEREIAIAKEIAQELRNISKTDHDSNTGYSLRKRRELEEKAEIVEELAGIVSNIAYCQPEYIAEEADRLTGTAKAICRKCGKGPEFHKV